MMAISIRVVKTLLNLAANVSDFFCMYDFRASRLRAGLLSRLVRTVSQASPTTTPACGSDDSRCRQSAVDDQAITFPTALLTLASTEQAGGFAMLTRRWQFFVHLLFRVVGEALDK